MAFCMLFRWGAASDNRPECTFPIESEIHQASFKMLDGVDSSAEKWDSGDQNHAGYPKIEIQQQINSDD